MLKNLFRLPNAFESDDARCKQILNIILIAFAGLALFTPVLFLGFLPAFEWIMPVLIRVIGFVIVVNTALWAANHSPKMPGWLSAVIFIAFLIFLITQMGALTSLGTYRFYTSAGPMLWMLPLLVATLTLRPVSVFVVAGVESILMLLSLTYLVDLLSIYYDIIALFVIALLCWLVATMLNRAIRDARHQAENAMQAERRQTENMEAILNTIKDGVLVLDTQGNFISANQALLAMIPEDKLREINSKPLEETIEWKRTVFSVSGSLLPGMGSVLVFRDETRRHEADRARDALLAIASHELRTPLGSVMNYIELLMQLLSLGKVNSKKFTMYLARAYENSQRLLVLINNIIDQAQLQARVLDLKWDRCNLPDLFEKSRQLLADQIREKDLSYELTIAPDVPEEIISDSERLHQVLMNLIGNAIKFTHKGGVKVTVSLPSQERLCIQVADTGPGIPYEQLPDIFEVFRRGSNYATRNHQGAGLGLSIVKELVSRMGGDISADSTLGLGSVFSISLPLILPEDE